MKDTNSQVSLHSDEDVNKLSNTTPERSVEEIVEGFMTKYCRPAYFEMPLPTNRQEQVIYDQGKLAWHTAKDQLTQTLQAERQKREEVVKAEREKYSPKIIHGSQMHTYIRGEEYVRRKDITHKLEIASQIEIAIYRLREAATELEALTQPNNQK